MKDKRIGMLMGGFNAEHEVSLNTGRALGDALRKRGYEVSDIIVDEKLPAALVEKRIEVAFVALHGRWGEDGCVQGLLEAMRIPYTGSSVLASALSMDKVVAKKVFRFHGLRVVEDLVVQADRARGLEAGDLPFSLPAVVKPSREGSSVGTSIVRQADQLREALDEAARFAGDILIERYVPGREIQVGVLDDRVLGAIEVRPAEAFYNYRAKYAKGAGTQYLFPAPIGPEQTERVSDLCLKAHQCLGCRGVSRVDTIFSEDEDAFFLLEVNTIPGMTETSLVPKMAAGLGMSFEDLAEQLLMGAALKA
ncbi:MAG: D-alanine--D-alanine ligase [Deltaproteobacteria bacterium]|nr:D-alanine--D-alanine ligase [Deltaproteobacteria bacterium]